MREETEKSSRLVEEMQNRSLELESNASTKRS